MIAKIVLPLVFAIILKLLLQPASRTLERLHLPRILAALLLIIALFGTIVGLGTAISGPAGTWAAKLPEGIPRLQERLEPNCGAPRPRGAAQGASRSDRSDRDVLRRDPRRADARSARRIRRGCDQVRAAARACPAPCVSRGTDLADQESARLTCRALLRYFQHSELDRRSIAGFERESAPVRTHGDCGVLESRHADI